MLLGLYSKHASLQAFLSFCSMHVMGYRQILANRMLAVAVDVLLGPMFGP